MFSIWSSFSFSRHLPSSILHPLPLSRSPPRLAPAGTPLIPLSRRSSMKADRHLSHVTKFIFLFCRVLRRPTKPDGCSLAGVLTAQSPIPPAHFMILSPDLGGFRRTTHHATARARLGAW